MTVAQSAANTPTAIETCEPLIALSSTSRPQRSPPQGSVIARSGSVIFNSPVRRSHSAYFGASGSIALRSGATPLCSARLRSAPSRFGRSPRNAGFAYGTPISRLHPPPR